jgi:hypothetical protein
MITTHVPIAMVGLLLTLAVTGSTGQKPAAPNAKRISACSLLTREEVKKHAPWAALLDQFETEEEPIGTAYPSVMIQVLPYTPNFFEVVRQRGKLEAVSGVGEEAYFYENPAGYAELYARVGKHILTIQRNLGTGERAAVAKPGVTTLAQALAAKLR